MKLSVKGMTFSGVIAAAYVVLTLPFAAVAFGPIQFRAAEALTLLPFCTPYAIPGLFFGCFLSNLLFSTPIDAIVGSLATLVAAILTYKCKNVWVSAIPPVVVNALAIGLMLSLIGGSFTFGVFISYFVSIFLSQSVICFAGGVPLVKLVEKFKKEGRI